VFPEAVAVKVVIPDVPPRLSVPVAKFTSVPAPPKLVATVNEFVFDNEIVVEIFGMENVPVNVCGFVVKLQLPPTPGVNVPLFVIPPRNSTVELMELFHVPPLAIVTSPPNTLEPVAEEKIKLPLVPPPTVVVPETVKGKPAAVKVVPFPIDRFVEIPRVAPVVKEDVPANDRFPLTTAEAVFVAVAEPLSDKFPVILVIAPKVSAPPDRVKS
jgi:hypothetical protein